MVWQPNILNNCYELSGGYAPPNHPPGALPLDPAGGLPFPDPLCPPPPNPNYATELRPFSFQNTDRQIDATETPAWEMCQLALFTSLFVYMG